MYQSSRSTRANRSADVQSLRELNTWLKRTIEAQTDRKRIRARGMAWNVRHDRNGHLRLPLRHDRHSLPVIVLSIIAQRLPIHVDNGHQLIVEGKIEVYQPWDQLQLVAGSSILTEPAEERQLLSVRWAHVEAEWGRDQDETNEVWI